MISERTLIVIIQVPRLHRVEAQSPTFRSPDYLNIILLEIQIDIFKLIVIAKYLKTILNLKLSTILVELKYYIKLIE